jgi:N-6 DNA methylase
MTDYIAKHVGKQTRGWAIPYLLGLDTMPGVGWGRWAYWLKICETLELPDEPIPQIPFCQPHVDTRWIQTHPNHKQLTEHPFKHIERVLKPYIWECGSWFDDAWLALVRWLLHSFGRQGLEDEVSRISEKVRDHWYAEFNLAYLLVLPIDWSAFILQSGPRWMGNGQAKWAKSTAFYSTPMNLCQMMCSMTIMTAEGDQRAKTVSDPCCGTGSMLLPASNHSLRLYGMDIVHDLCLCAELNGYFYMPWLVCQPPGIDEMWIEITGETVPAARPVKLETEPEAVAAIQAQRQEQFAFYEAMKAEPASAKKRPVARPIKVCSLTAEQLELV